MASSLWSMTLDKANNDYNIDHNLDKFNNTLQDERIDEIGYRYGYALAEMSRTGELTESQLRTSLTLTMRDTQKAGRN